MREDYLKFTDVKNAVNVSSLFKPGVASLTQSYVKKYDFDERAKQERKQIAAQLIQRSYRKHLRDKRFIENRLPVDSELLKWARQYKEEIIRRKQEFRKTFQQKQKE
jgi:hypothetical protein